MLGKSVLLFVVGFLNVLVGAIVLSRDSKKLQNQLFFIFSVSLGGWVAGIGGFLLSESPDSALRWAKAYYLFPLIIAVTMPLFSRSFPFNEKIPKKWVIPIISGFLMVAVPLLVLPDFITTDVAYHDWGKEIVLNKAQYLLYSVFLLSSFIAGLTHLYIKARRYKGLARAQTMFFFTGFLITSLFGVLFNLILPWVGNYRLIWLGPLFTNAFIIATGYGMVRHRMFDVQLIVVRSLTYALSITSLGTLYALIGFTVVNRLAESSLGTRFNQQLFFTILAVILSFTFQPLRRFFDRITSKVFYRDAYQPQDLIDNFNRVLVSNIDLDQVLTKSAQVISEYLKPSFVLFGIREGESDNIKIMGDTSVEWSIEQLRKLIKNYPEKLIVSEELPETHYELKEILDNDNISVVLRLASDNRLEGIGYLMLGSKKSGNPYTNQDIRVLNIIGNELAIAMQNALQFEEIQKFNVTLQETVDEKTKQLRKSNEKLKQMDETKDEFISMASHQLRTPLTSVKGYVSMVIEGDAGDLNPMQKKLLDQAFVSSQRMVYLIADLLNVSRLRTGKFIIEPIKCNLADVIQGEIEQLGETAESRSLELTYDKPKDFPELLLDETKIRQVIMNFIDNAIYYTPTGGHIRVQLRDTGKTIEYIVTDDGLGVPKSEQHHLFNKFFRAGNAKKARPDGTGLGLFMAKKVIVAQGGSIIFTSQEGKGSTFGFSFSKEKLKVPENYEPPAPLNGIKSGPTTTSK